MQIVFKMTVRNFRIIYSLGTSAMDKKIIYDLSTIVTLFLTENSSTYALMIENTFRIEEGIVKDCKLRHMSVKKSFLKLYT